MASYAVVLHRVRSLILALVLMLALTVACTSPNDPAEGPGATQTTPTPTAPAEGPGATQPTPSPAAPTIASPVETPPTTQSPSPATTPPSVLPTILGVELQPEDPSPGGQFVLVLNQSSEPIDLGCWTVRSAATGSVLVVEAGLQVPPGGVARLTPEDGVLQEVDRLQLLDPASRLIDQTPELRDVALDDRVWFRESDGGWRFGRTLFPGEVIDGLVTVQRPPSC